MLTVKDLQIAFHDHGVVHEVVHGVTFDIHPGEIVGIVGESGSGKSQTALAIIGLLRRSITTATGSICLDGVDLLPMTRAQLRDIQGRDISMVFQEPMSSLNPTMRIGPQVEEVLRIHSNCTAGERHERALAALRDVELPDPETVLRKYPHQLSGGQRQRVMLASAIIGRPRLLIADEPTTALDVTVQEQILKLLVKLNGELGMAILFISHDLRVIRKLCSRVLVMNEGRIVEQGPAEEIFRHPQDPYTQKLIACIPTRARRAEDE